MSKERSKISVTGKAEIHHTPERAAVIVSAESEEKSQEEVFKNISSTSAKIKDIVESIRAESSASDSSITNWSNSGLSTSSFPKYDQNGEVNGRAYLGKTIFEIEFQDFDRLSEFATRLATLEHASISGVIWRLTQETRARLEGQARQEAVRDAKMKHEDYRKALGWGDSYWISHLKDKGESDHDYDPTVRDVAPRMLCTSGGGESINLKPEDVTISSSVWMEFQH